MSCNLSFADHSGDTATPFEEHSLIVTGLLDLARFYQPNPKREIAGGIDKRGREVLEAAIAVGAR